MVFRHTQVTKKVIQISKKNIAKTQNEISKLNWGTVNNLSPVGGARTDRRSNWKSGLSPNNECPLLIHKRIFVRHLTMLEIILGSIDTSLNMADKIPTLDSSVCQAQEFGLQSKSNGVKQERQYKQSQKGKSLSV